MSPDSATFPFRLAPRIAPAAECAAPGPDGQPWGDPEAVLAAIASLTEATPPDRWILHPDERVPLAVITHYDRHIARHADPRFLLLARALADAEDTGLRWTPLLESLVTNYRWTPGSVGAYQVPHTGRVVRLPAQSVATEPLVEAWAAQPQPPELLDRLCAAYPRFAPVVARVAPVISDGVRALADGEFDVAYALAHRTHLDDADADRLMISWTPRLDIHATSGHAYSVLKQLLKHGHAPRPVCRTAWLGVLDELDPTDFKHGPPSYPRLVGPLDLLLHDPALPRPDLERVYDTVRHHQPMCELAVRHPAADRALWLRHCDLHRQEPWRRCLVDLPRARRDPEVRRRLGRSQALTLLLRLCDDGDLGDFAALLRQIGLVREDCLAEAMERAAAGPPVQIDPNALAPYFRHQDTRVREAALALVGHVAVDAPSLSTSEADTTPGPLEGPGVPRRRRQR